ncbi:MAG TPA: F0F1 ATP synthase subunit delta [Mycobacteriales bacterium]|jgi:F-type H+-transporting ATPase subunit delta|nr:F0F1 ATP synthase subunit delta [Mycobacteriales bacterium]
MTESGQQQIDEAVAVLAGQVVGSSRVARTAVRSAVADVPVAELNAVAADLHAVVDLLALRSGLRHALADPATPAAAKSALLQRLLGDKIGGSALRIVDVAATQRWTTSRDVVDALEEAGTEATLALADADGSLSDVEDELFRFGRILEREPQLTLALSDVASPAQGKSRLVDSLLEGKVSPTTLTLVRRAVSAPRGLPVARAVASIAELASARRRQLLATVKSAVPLDSDQVERLSRSLERLYGRAVHVQLDIEPALIGGVSVRVGDEVVDGSIRHRLGQVRARLAH